MSVINTNTKSIVAQNALTINNRSMNKAMEQLSTGKRINAASDDAAGLAIANKMTSQIKGLNQAVRNANDGISLLQTAEGSMVEMTNMLQRMRELAVQSGNDTNTATDRDYLDLEFQQLVGEISRISKNTQWNGMNILNNTAIGTENLATGARDVKIQVGANANQTIDLSFKNFDFGVGTPATASKTLLNLGADADLAAGKNLQLTIGTTVFDTSIATAVAAAGITAAETTSIATALNDVVSKRVGFENVKITASGTTILVEDSEGRAVTPFSLKKADATEVGAAVTLTVQQAGAAATGAVAPDAKTVFSGTAALNNQNIKTLAAANTAITNVTNAIGKVSEQRSTLGAVMNRLNYAADNLTNVSANTQASRSRVEDTDYAQATTELARTQIIAQAATAMLAQANQAPQSVLALLR
jgi:flagellin